MKKVMIALLVVLMATMVLAKPITKITYTEQHDVDGDGVLDTVIVEETLKETKKSTTLERDFFTADYVEYLGQELTVDGVLFVDTFTYN